MKMIETIAGTIDAAGEEWAKGTLNMPWEIPSELLAVAILKAMREPTYDMVFKSGIKQWPGVSKNIWQRMIDKAIKEASE